MNWDRIQGKWKQAKGKARQKWGKLTDDDLTMIAGSRDQLVGKIQERYGVAKDAAERQVDEFISSYDASPRESTESRQEDREHAHTSKNH